MARDSMKLEEVIQLTKQALEKVNPDKRVSTEFRFTVEQVALLLVCLEDYKQLKADYIELDKQLRTANTEIDRLQSVNSWIPCSERLPEKDMSVLISAQGHRVTAYYDSVKRVFMLTETEGLFYSMSAVTHWMPLPEVPQRKDDTNDND